MEKTIRIGTVTSISEPIPMKSLGKDNQINKIEVAISLDEKQEIYVDLIGSKTLMAKNLEKGDIVKAIFTFRGSNKNGTKYNNLYCHGLIKL